MYIQKKVGMDEKKEMLKLAVLRYQNVLQEEDEKWPIRWVIKLLEMIHCYQRLTLSQVVIFCCLRKTAGFFRQTLTIYI